MELYREETGYGEPIVFLHGFGASTYTWRHLKPLSRNYRLIFLDMKGFGASPKPDDGRYSVHDQAESVEEFMLSKGLSGVTLAGHSFGGGVALMTALRLKDKKSKTIKRLILIGSAAYRQEEPLFAKVLKVPFFGPLAFSLIPARLQALYVLRESYHDVSKISCEQVRRYAAPLRAPGASAAFVSTARQLIPPDIDEMTARFNEIDLPALLIWGSDDRIIPVEIAGRLSRDIPSASLKVITGCGHIPQEEKPEETLRMIRDFLERTA